ncbi:MAG: S1 RNA-binding domain-containing protein [Deltaproteobacteria bacterium]|nr:S1 RNA-binding domain-containing protein [Deltaproteobacteria bacterium]
MAKESFADLFSRGEVVIAKAKTLRNGDEAEGLVAYISSDAVFLDLDDKQQAFFERIDLEVQDPITGEKTLPVKLGDRLKGFVMSSENGQIKLKKRLGKGEVSTEHLQLAFESGVAVEGKVTGVNKGGVDVDIAGIRAFCPISQLEDHRIDDANAYVGRNLPFVITKLEGRNVVVSRRTLLEREAKDARERTLAGLAIGTIVKGRVSQLRDFGAFVDLGGIEGLVPLRELSHDRLRPEDVVQLGDVLEVQIKDIAKKTDAKGREKTEITLSLKALAKDPWENIEVIAPIGKVVAGTVTRTADFGAFVRIGSGIEGLLHISELGARVKRTEDALAIGQNLLVKVQSVDTSKKRVSLALASDGLAVGAIDTTKAVVVGSIVKAVVEKIESYGVVVQLAGVKGRSGRGTIPNAETNTRPGTDLRKEFPQGKEITAKVLEASEGRVRLSIKAALDDAERADFDNFRATSNASGMGTFGDLLKSKLAKK